MKVAFVNTVYAPNEIGGAERTVRTLAESLARNGHDVIVISLAPDGKRTQRVIEGVRVYYEPLKNLYWPHGAAAKGTLKRLLWHTLDAFNPFMGLAVARILRAERPDVVQMGNLQGFSVACWVAARALHVPLVQMLHDYYLGCPNASMFKRGANCARQCSACRLLTLPRRTLSDIPDTVISLSQRTLDRLEGCDMFEGVRRKEIVHGACDMPASSAPRRDKTPGEAIVVGYLGRIEQTKGIEVLLSAVATLDARTVSVLLGGRGEQGYVARLRKASDAPNVEFLDFVQPADFFARVDVLVVPSLWEEPLGRVIYEGYHYGVPAIVSRAGGMPEIVDEGRTGFVFTAGDSRELAALLSTHIERGWRGAQFAEACLEKSREFDADRVYPRYLDIWESAARSASRP